MSVWLKKADLPQATLRATAVGLAIGSVVLVSNFQFGLQTGWVSMMSLPSALLGYTLFKVSPWLARLTDVENVYVQSVAVAVGTGPLAYGLVGIVPAIEKFLTSEETGTGSKISFSTLQLVVWLMGLALFGVFFAVPLRKQVIIKEKLPFPSGSATATLISVLHGTSEPTNSSYSNNIRSLVVTFAISATYTVSAYFLPVLKSVPLFGSSLAAYQWTLQPSPAYVGQGIIMGLPLVSYMLFGAVLGWGVLAPMAKYLGWAPGPIDDWVTGGQGWILWLSLSVMISDSLVSFFVVTIKSAALAYHTWNREQKQIDERRLLGEDAYDDDLDLSDIDDVPPAHLVSTKTTVVGLVASSVVCVAAVRHVFGPLVPYYATTAAIVLALLFSVLGVRALGETDLNPVSGIGKLLQLIFAVLIPRSHPSKVLINLVAGGIAEAGAQQAGDLMQDLKTGHLVGALPRAQFTAQVVGTVYLVILSSVMYKVYNSVYRIPSKMFRIPTAVVWIDCSRLVTGEGLPPHAFEFCLLFGLIFGAISIVKNVLPPKHRLHRYLIYLPNGVAVGIGIYNTPNFTLARFIGGVAAYVWLRHSNDKVKMVIVSLGLVLGEGLMSGFTMLLTSLGVRHL